MNPRIAIMLVNWNRREDTLECLESLERVSFPRDCLGIFVGDNASEDGSQEAIRSQLARMRAREWQDLVLVEFEKNLGFARANNRLLEVVPDHYDYVYCSNNDVVFVEDILTILAGFMEKDPTIGTAGPKVLSHSQPDRLAHGAGYVYPLLCGTRSVDAKKLVDCDFLTGCGLLVRRQVLRELGRFFDEDFFAYWEDTDFCARVRRRGYRVVYCPQARVLHKVGAASGGGWGMLTSPARIYYDVHSKFIFARKHLHPFARLLFVLLFAIRIPLFVMRALVKSPRTAVGRIEAYLRACLHGLAGRPGREFELGDQAQSSLDIRAKPSHE